MRRTAKSKADHTYCLQRQQRIGGWNAHRGMDVSCPFRGYVLALLALFSCEWATSLTTTHVLLLSKAF